MFWMIGGDDREYGPVPENQLRDWIREGRANAQTRIRRDPDSAWEPLALFPEFAADLAAVAAAWSAASQNPTAPFPDTDTDTDGPAPAQPATPVGDLDIADCLSRSWAVLSRHGFVIASVCAAVWALLLAASMITGVGPFLSLAITGPLYAGLSLVLLRVVRGQNAMIGEVFTFFGPRFPQLMLLGLTVEIVSTLGLFLCLVPGLVLKVFWIFSYVLAAERPGNFWAIMEESRRMVLPRFLPLTLLLLVAWMPVVLFSAYVGLRSAGVFNELFMGSGAFLYDRESFLEFARFSSRLELQRAVVILLNMPFALTATALAYQSLFKARPAAPDATP